MRVLTVYGGRSYEPQIEALATGVDVVVGTPGRLLDLVEKRHLHLGAIAVLVLDEADEMLDLGFLPDVERIVALTPADRQTMLFSATMPGDVVTLARRYMSQPTHIRAVSPDEDGSQLVKTVEQHVYRAHPLDKPEMMARILQATGRGHTIVFCRTKRHAQRLADDLTERGFAVGAVHGDLGQGAREQAMRAFRNGKVDVLVATDVAARGIDVEGITHVINYSCPEDEKTYVHRIGRTARAGATGVAITFVDWDDLPRWSLINKALGLSFDDPVETYSTSEHLFAELGIPAAGGQQAAARPAHRGRPGRRGARGPRRDRPQAPQRRRRARLLAAARPPALRRPGRVRSDRRGRRPRRGAASAPAGGRPAVTHGRRSAPGATTLTDDRRSPTSSGARPRAVGSGAAAAGRRPERPHPSRADALQLDLDAHPGPPSTGRASHPRAVASTQVGQVDRRHRQGQRLRRA